MVEEVYQIGKKSIVGKKTSTVAKVRKLLTDSDIKGEQVGLYAYDEDGKFYTYTNMLEDFSVM